RPRRRSAKAGRALVATRIGVFVFDGAEELDFVGPWEVLATWAKSFPDDDVDIFTVALGPDAVTCAKGLRVIPDHTIDSAPAVDVSAGIDMALHLVARLCSVERAREVKKFIQYDPAPPV